MTTPAAPTSQRISAPALPQQRPRAPFPVIGALAPVVMSVAMWLVTGSALALMFAALGPAIAIANLVDSRVHGARAARKDRATFELECTAVECEIDAAHDRERRWHDRVAPSAVSIIEAPVAEAVRWGRSNNSDLLVQLGTGVGASEVILDGAKVGRADDPFSERLRHLHSLTRELVDDPVIVSARGGIAVVGESVLAVALARSLLVQLSAVAEPAAIGAVALSQAWLVSLGGAVESREREAAPRANLRAQRINQIVGLAAEVTMIDGCRIEVAPQLGEVSSTVAVVVQVHGVFASIVRSPGGDEARPFRVAYTSDEHAQGWARRAAKHHAAISATNGRRDPPDTLDFDPSAAVAAGGASESRGSLECEIGADGSGPYVIDLVTMGPHAVVGGTTGSGKSELLVTWIVAMAARYSPRQVNFLLFDFKGGSSFGAVATLQHTVGLVTDLDGSGARRAFESLAAELRYRECVLAAEAVRHVDELAEARALPRLVVVVDEFAAMATDFPELHAEFGDLAARGRSLGVHLILCTQRPAGVVRDSLLANTNLRLSLRVNNSADSVAVIGTGEAAESGIPQGRVLMARDGILVRAQVARVALEHIEAIREHWEPWVRSEQFTPRRPWLSPLAAQIDFTTLPFGAFAVNDRPDVQRQDPVCYTPERHGNLLVVGGSRSGKSAALRSLAAAHSVREGAGDSAPPTPPPVFSADPELCWDALSERSTQPLLLDDLDLLISLYDAEYHSVFVERLTAVMRRGERRVVLAVQRFSGPVQSLASLCDTRLVLRMPTKQDHIMVGGAPEAFDPRLPPGGGWFDGERVQVAAAPSSRLGVHESVIDGSPVAFTPAAMPQLLVVSPRPEGAAVALRTAGWNVSVGAMRSENAVGGIDSAQLHDVLLGDPDAWQRGWATFASLSRERPVLFDGCSVAELRTLARTRELPPPINDPQKSSWLLLPGGELRRVRFASSPIG